MVSANTLCKKLLNVKSVVVEDVVFYSDQKGAAHVRIRARPDRRHQNDCPFCHKHCKYYDSQSTLPRLWRGLTGAESLLRLRAIPTVSIALSTVSSSQMSHGLTPAAALQRTLTSRSDGLPHTCPGAPFSKAGNDEFFVHINTTTIVVNSIHKGTSRVNLRHGTLSVIILLYVLLP